MFEGECKCGLRHIVTRTNKFPIIAVIEIKILGAIHKIIKIIELKTKRYSIAVQLLGGVRSVAEIHFIEISAMNLELIIIPERSQMNYTCFFFIIIPSV